MHLLGGLFKIIIHPIVTLIATIFYKALIKIPLEILNFIQQAFLFLSGAGVDRLLFNSSLEDGGVKMNFFTTPSPMQKFYIIMFSIAGALGAIFLSIATFKTIVSSKNQQVHGSLAATARISGGMFGMTLIPLLTMGFLSLVGAISNVFNGGKNTPPSRADVNQVFNLKQKISKIDEFNHPSIPLNDQPAQIYVLADVDGVQDWVAWDQGFTNFVPFLTKNPSTNQLDPIQIPSAGNPTDKEKFGVPFNERIKGKLPSLTNTSM